jgi:tetratricopeptide (TPR) repeat protein
MKLASVLVAVCVLTAATLGCSRHRQEAVIKANEGDQAVKVNVDGAIAKYDEATKLDPNNHLIFYKLALAHRKKEDWEKVASTLARATQIAPEWANYWFERGYALEMQAKAEQISYEDCKEPYLNCIKQDPNYADCYEQLGNAYLWTDDEQKALEYYTKAIEHNPDEIRYYSALADLYIRLDLMTEAEQVLKEAKARGKAGDRMLFGVHVLLSQIHQDRGDLSSMVTELEAAKGIVGDEGSEAIQILYSLGSTYAKVDPPRKAEAISMLKGFFARACKGRNAAKYKAECETTSTLVTGLGGTLQ